VYLLYERLSQSEHRQGNSGPPPSVQEATNERH